MADRVECIRRFRAALVADVDALAAVTTGETGKPITQARNEIKGLLPRIDFFHWVLVDIDPKSTEIKAGEFSSGITTRGKAGPGAPRGTRQGINDYTMWFSGDRDMSGDYYGYDGPCPPWNDSIVHHYVFTL